MKKINILNVSFIIFFSNNLFAQQPDPLSFFPHSVGNVWEYDTPTGFRRYEIIAVSHAPDSSIYIYLNWYPTYRIDTNMFVYSSPTDLNWRQYKLDADSGETWMVYPEEPGQGRMEALMKDKYSSVVFGKHSVVMEIEYWTLVHGDTVINEQSIYRNTEILVSGFGLLYAWTAHGYEKFVRGCVIDSDTFGIVTSVEDDVQLIEDFHLSQNYPNPFNPTTTISYQLPISGFVELKIYDVLGSEVATLVNELKPEGVYSVNFNATNLPSGVYIYSLRVNDFVQNRKMILIR